MDLQQLQVGIGPILAALIGVNHQLIGFDLSVAKGPVERLQHQYGLHRGAHRPIHNPPAVEIDPLSCVHLSVRHRQIAPATFGADGGHVTGPAAVGSWGCNVLLQ